MEIVLAPIDGPPAEKLAEAYTFLEPDVIPAGTYPGIGAVQTLGVAAQWLVGAEVDEELVYGITRALWHPSARALLDNGHPRARDIRLERALKGLAVPLHPGAERWYREAGLLPEAQPEPAAAPR
jgi:TRAP transporter TAXI family solute receptor